MRRNTGIERARRRSTSEAERLVVDECDSSPAASGNRALNHPRMFILGRMVDARLARRVGTTAAPGRARRKLVLLTCRVSLMVFLYVQRPLAIASEMSRMFRHIATSSWQ